MKLTNFGGATAIVEHEGKRILFDPWLDDGIFHGAWYHYPPLKVGIPDLGRLDYVYISHIHEDHCSAGTIKHINPDAEIIVMDREPNLVLRFLKSNGFTFNAIHKIAPQTPRELAPGLVVDMVTADPQHAMNFLIDSGLILKWGDRVLYNANDCPPYEGGLQYIKDNYSVDLALLPYAGGSGYPACYTNLSDDEKLQEAARVQADSTRGFINAVQVLNPRLAMPFADQYVIAGSRSHLNRFMGHPPGAGAVVPALREAGLLDKLVLLNSGQTLDLESGTKTPDELFYAHTEQDRERYIHDEISDKPYDHEAFDLAAAVPLDRLVEYARARLWLEQKKQDYFPEFSYYLAIPDRQRLFRIDLSKEGVEALPFDSPREEPFLGLSTGATLCALLLIGHVSWNIADAALFLDYERRPNRYDTRVHAFVNYLRV